MGFLRVRPGNGFVLLALVLALACGGGDGDPPGSAEGASGAEPQGPTGVAREFTAPQDRIGNGAPEIVAAHFEPARPTPGSSVRAIVETLDPDGDDVWLQYTWRINGLDVDGATTDRLLLRDVEKGAAVEVEIVANDGKDRSEPWRVESEIFNAIPEIGLVRMEPESVVAGDQPIVVRPEATDRDGDPIVFLYTWKVNGREVAETGPSLDTKGLRRGDRVAVSVAASDGRDTSEPYELQEIRVANAAPRILSKPGDPASDSGAFYQIHAEDPDGDSSLQYSLEDAPEGMRVNVRTGAIDWQPTPDQVGTHTIVVVVDDLQGGRSRQTIQVTVGEVEAAQSPAQRR